MILMHKNTPVADVLVINGKIFSIKKILNEKHLPEGTLMQTSELLQRSLSNWQSVRAIPNERQNAEQIIKKIGCSLSEASLKNMGVSLTDCYWFKDNGNLTWKDVNYHDNGFSHDFVKSCLLNTSNFSFNTPDFTTDGALEKYWLSIDGIPSLIKFGNLRNIAQNNLLSANEIIASRVACLMGIDHVQYNPISVEKNGKLEIVSYCSSFITNSNTEFVSAIQLERAYAHGSSAELYNYFCSIGQKRQIDSMILFDYIIGNTDRHEKNFGIIRNPDTLETVSFAPLFDSGSCLAFDGISDITKTDVKPFNRDANDQIKRVSIIDKIPDEKYIKELIKEVYEQFNIPEPKYDLACEAISNNINNTISWQKKSYISREGFER